MGALLIEINSGVESAEEVRAEVERFIGFRTAVRMAKTLYPIEIRDLDGVTTKKKVLEVISV